MPKKVMIVEDNELNMKLFRDLIEASGYETVQTRNGMEAMDLARVTSPISFSWIFSCRKCQVLK